MILSPLLVISALVIEFIIDAFCELSAKEFHTNSLISKKGGTSFILLLLYYISLQFVLLNFFHWCSSCFRFIYDLLAFFSLFSLVGIGNEFFFFFFFFYSILFSF